MNGYYLHSRKIFELYIKTPVVLAVCEVILYSVRYNPYVQNGIQVNRGQCLLKYEEISQLCGISVSQVRTAIKRFVADGGISVDNMGKKGLLITLLPAFSCESVKIGTEGGSTGIKASVSSTYGSTAGGSVPYGRYPNRPVREIPPVNIGSDAPPSYDLKRAEERARARVPELKKRVR